MLNKKLTPKSDKKYLSYKYKGLQLAIDLAAQPTRAALTRHFVSILNDLYRPISMALYRPEYGQTIEAKRNMELADVRVFDYLTPASKPSLPLHTIQGAYTCAANKELVELKDNAHTTSYLPIQSCGSVCEILAVEHQLETLQDEELFHALIALFENLLNIFNLAERDSLTNLLNRKAFDKTITQIHNKQHQDFITRSKHHYVYLALIDIDHFKRINDQFGHLYGDEILIGFARLMEQSFRRQDWIFRYGGEEFAAIIEDVSPQHIELVLNRFRETVERHHFPFVGTITISIGCVHIEGGGASPLTIDKADKALYFSKEHGRNRVSVYENLLSKGELVEQSATESDVTLFQSPSHHEAHEEHEVKKN
jgi:diguanylate cyclase (GGDEF)-like protein